MLRLLSRQIGCSTSLHRRSVACSSRCERHSLRGALVFTNPVFHRTRKGAVLQRINHVDAGGRRHRKLQTFHRLAADLRQKRVEFEIGGLGGSHPFGNTVIASQHLEQQHVRVIAHCIYMCSRALIGRLLRPFRLVPRRQLSVLNDAARSTTIAQQNQISFRSRLSERGIQHFLQICSAAQPAGAHHRQCLLYLIRRRSDRRWRKQRHVGIEQQQVELVCRFQRMQQTLQRLEISIQLLPLHRKRIIEKSDHSLGRSRCRGQPQE